MTDFIQYLSDFSIQGWDSHLTWHSTFLCFLWVFFANSTLLLISSGYECFFVSFFFYLSLLLFSFSSSLSICISLFFLCLFKWRYFLFCFLFFFLFSFVALIIAALFFLLAKIAATIVTWFSINLHEFLIVQLKEFLAHTSDINDLL